MPGLVYFDGNSTYGHTSSFGPGTAGSRSTVRALSCCGRCARAAGPVRSTGWTGSASAVHRCTRTSLSWAELTAAADNGLPGGSTTDPHARLLLLLPSFGDAAVPDEAFARLTAALRACTRVEAPERLAVARLGYQGEWGPTHWTTAEGGYPINDGGYSFRNPANRFAWPTARLAQVATANTSPVSATLVTALSQLPQPAVWAGLRVVLVWDSEEDGYWLTFATDRTDGSAWFLVVPASTRPHGPRPRPCPGPARPARLLAADGRLSGTGPDRPEEEAPSTRSWGCGLALHPFPPAVVSVGRAILPGTAHRP